MDLDVRRLRVLHEVALRGSVTAAAAALHVTPSAVSQQHVLRVAGQHLAGRGEHDSAPGPLDQLVTGLS
ncbi:helix-turn-helix domain-containing protein, partial [Micromonospora globispora]|uniref:helix-turn-helix domain-containing protein n=1 Tax=Micromonospora globispora TaxID=1450148 RepID=UPI000F5F0518